MSVMKPRMDRADGYVEDFRDLTRVTTLEMAKSQQRPLIGWQAAEAALETVALGDLHEIVRRARHVYRKDAKVEHAATLAFGLNDACSDHQPVQPGVEPVRLA
jgi:hypothetical protein